MLESVYHLRKVIVLAQVNALEMNVVEGQPGAPHRDRGALLPQRQRACSVPLGEDGPSADRGANLTP